MFTFRSRCETAMAIRLLIVDDDPLLTKSYSKFFELEGWSVMTASSGEEALRILTDPNGRLIQALAIPDDPTNRLSDIVSGVGTPAFIERIRKDRAPVFATGMGATDLQPIHTDTQCFLATYIPGPDNGIVGFI